MDPVAQRLFEGAREKPRGWGLGGLTGIQDHRGGRDDGADVMSSEERHSHEWCFALWVGRKMCCAGATAKDR